MFENSMACGMKPQDNELVLWLANKCAVCHSKTHPSWSHLFFVAKTVTAETLQKKTWEKAAHPTQPSQPWPSLLSVIVTRNHLFRSIVFMKSLCWCCSWISRINIGPGHCNWPMTLLTLSLASLDISKFFHITNYDININYNGTTPTQRYPEITLLKKGDFW